VTYVSDTQWGAKLIVSGTIGGVCGIMKNTGDYVDIIGFDMTYAPQGVCALGLLQDGNYGRIMGNRVHDLTGPDGTGVGGIIVDCCVYTKTGNQVIGNVVDNIGPPNGGSNLIHGIYLAGPGNSAVNNIVTRASAACISSYHGATRLIISNNVLTNCGRYGITISADSVDVPGGNDSTTVSNNIVVNNGQFGIQEYCEPHSQGPARVGSNNMYYNNIVYNNPGGHIQHCDGDASNEDSTIVLTSAAFAALFVNYTGDMSGDYHLRAGAVAIDRGTTRCAPGVTTCAPSTAFDGVRRPQGTAWDIGAYEFIP
ncbi:MAG: choice-of-anchor Q domain-containing protein, partial [Gemmatimonadales bacterium]